LETASQKNNLILTWLVWQFYEVPLFLLKAWKNYLAYAESSFSILLLVKTFFSPWRRYNWEYPKHVDVYQFFLALTSNIFSRFLGAIMRSVLIVVGALFYCATALIGLLILVAWILLPFLVLAGIYSFFLF
jgi:hypothetical protein